MISLVVNSVGHYFDISGGKPQWILHNVYIEIPERKFVSIIGPSGCGKSTLFNIIAGLIQPSVGTIDVNGKPVTGTNPSIAYMLQKDLLLDWRNVLDNVIIGAEILGVPKERARSEASEWLDRFGLRGFENKYPYALSGGMRQRVALLRTLITHREIMLLDEPFGSLDSQTRTMMQEFVLSLWGSLERTILLITHDIEESLILGDDVIIMTARPMQVKKKMTVNLPRPRTLDVVRSREFFDAKAELMYLIHEESRKSLREEEQRMRAIG